MCICDKIEEAKCCTVNIAEAYVKASTFGNNTEAMLNELLLMNSYTEALCRYECEHKENNDKIINKKITADCEKTISLNCLAEQNICFILEQIRLQCGSCECGC